MNLSQIKVRRERKREMGEQITKRAWIDKIGRDLESLFLWMTRINPAAEDYAGLIKPTRNGFGLNGTGEEEAENLFGIHVHHRS